jgi:hypothetical protein
VLHFLFFFEIFSYLHGLIPTQDQNHPKFHGAWWFWSGLGFN